MIPDIFLFSFSAKEKSIFDWGTRPRIKESLSTENLIHKHSTAVVPTAPTRSKLVDFLLCYSLQEHAITLTVKGTKPAPLHP